MLDRSFIEEVLGVLKEMVRDKAPRLDGFLLELLEHCEERCDGGFSRFPCTWNF